MGCRSNATRLKKRRDLNPHRISKQPIVSLTFAKEGRGAATALQFEGIDCQLLARFDSDLQRVIDAWGTLPTAIKKAVMTLVEHT